MQDGWIVSGYDDEQGITIILEKNNKSILIEFQPYREDLACYARTGRFNVVARILFAYHLSLNDEERSVVNQIIHIVQSFEENLFASEINTTIRIRKIQKIEVEQVLIPEGNNHYYLNPYTGCLIGCHYCYVDERANLSRNMRGLPSAKWGNYLDIKMNAPKILQEEVKRFAPGPVRISPIITDPYQLAEKKYNITRQCLKILLENKFMPILLTRSTLVLRDIELFKQYSNAIIIGVSISTNQDSVREKFEPRADSIEKRIQTLKTLYENDIATMVVIQPILPMDANELVDMIAGYTKLVRIDKMHNVDSVKKIYIDNEFEYAMSDDYFNSTRETLAVNLKTKGIILDENDNLSVLAQKLLTEK